MARLARIRARKTALGLLVVLCATILAGCVAAPAGGYSAAPLPSEEDSATIGAAADSTPTASADPTTEDRSLPATSRTVIGASVEGRDIVADRFGDGARMLLVVGGIHGNEYGADVADALVTALRSDPTLVPADTQVHIIPSINPDGRASDSRGNANGVDLNLNMPAQNWQHDLHSATRAAQSGLHGGASAGSEPETQAFIGYLEHAFDVVVSLHSSGNIIDFDGAGSEPIAQRMSRATGMPAQHLAVQPYATGTMGQYVPEVWNTPVITIELGSADLNPSLRDAILSAADPL